MAKKATYTRAVGADFDTEHDMLFREYCRLANIDGATFIRAACYPILDDFKTIRDAVTRKAMGFPAE